MFARFLGGDAMVTPESKSRTKLHQTNEASKFRKTGVFTVFLRTLHNCYEPCRIPLKSPFTAITRVRIPSKLHTARQRKVKPICPVVSV